MFATRNVPILGRSVARKMGPLYSNSASPKIKTGIVMLNMGGPQRTDQVADYLRQIMTDRDMIQLPFAQDILGPWIARKRTPDVQKKYEEIGGGSPILKWTNTQGALLCKALDQTSPQTAPHKHYVSFRYVHPNFQDAFEEIEKDGVQKIVLFSQYPQYSCATSGSSFNAVYKYLKTKDISNKYKISVIDRWPTHPLFVKCYADLINAEAVKFPSDKKFVILFSAHSLPLKTVNRGDAYPFEVGATVHDVMLKLNYSYPHQLVWQSKVGPLPWLGPFTDDAIRDYVKKGIKNFIIVPIAFVNEHIETLHELDIEYCKELAEEVGVETIKRVSAPNDNPVFIEALADIVKTHLSGSVAVSKKFLNRCPHCTNENCHKSKSWYNESCRL